MLNKFYTSQEWYDEVLSSPMNVNNAGAIVAYYGGSVIAKDDGIVVFYGCEYCGSRDRKLDSRKNCAHCGAPVGV